VVAAVFSYVVLGAGFFTTQKAQETVYSSVDMASSSIEILGDVYGNSTEESGINSQIDAIQFVVGLTAGGGTIDFAKTSITYSDKDNVTIVDRSSAITSSATDVRVAKTAIAPNEWGIIDIQNDDNDKGALLENQEQFTIYVLLDTPNQISRNQDFSIEIRPELGAAYSIKRTAPARIYKNNVLY
ncbi:MAG: flagellin, partial [Methanomicrobiaceae archaeon]|nr:flagellin [Methanomicrobiaceae archaeon]